MAGRDAVLVAFDLDKRTTGVSSTATMHPVDGKLLAILLVAEPRLETKLFEKLQEQPAVADIRFELITT